MKKRTPHNPAQKANLDGHLGVPNGARQSHSRSGFERETLAENRFVSRERAMLTHPALLRDLYNEVVRKHEEKGEPLPDPLRIAKMTRSDRLTAPYSNLLWAYLKVRVEVLRGKIKIVDYEGAPTQRENGQVPLSQKQFDARRFYAWVREQHGLMSVTEFLDSIALQINPELAQDGEAAPTKADLGRDLIDVENARDAEAAADGALTLSCRALMEAARDFAIIERRYRTEVERLSRSRRMMSA